MEDVQLWRARGGSSVGHGRHTALRESATICVLGFLPLDAVDGGKVRVLYWLGVSPINKKAKHQFKVNTEMKFYF